MPCGQSNAFDYSKKLISKLGIGSKRNSSAPPKALFSNDYLREQVRQEIRAKVGEALELLGKRLAKVTNLEGRPVVISGGDSHKMTHLEFDTVYSGISPEGKVFVSSSDQGVPEPATLLFMSSKHKDWEIEPIESPNLETAYFRKIAEIEELCAEAERKR